MGMQGITWQAGDSGESWAMDGGGALWGGRGHQIGAVGGAAVWVKDPWYQGCLGRSSNIGFAAPDAPKNDSMHGPGMGTWIFCDDCRGLV